MRLFFSIDPPDTLQQQVTRQCPQIKGTKLTPTHQLHLTLLFMGEQPDQTVTEIAAALNTLKVTPFTLTTDRIGHFNSGIIWLGLKPCRLLLQLQKQLCHRLRQQGLTFEQRKFIPHITLARTKQRVTSKLLQEFITAFAGPGLHFPCDRIYLKSSQLNAAGAHHQIEAEFLPD